MYVIHHAHPGTCDADGVQRLAAAGPACELAAFQVWIHQLAPGVHSAAQRHDGELVAVALAGSGKVLLDGGPQRFQSPCTVVIPPQVEFEFVNNASIPLQLVVVFSAPPQPVGEQAPSDR